MGGYGPAQALDKEALFVYSFIHSFGKCFLSTPTVERGAGDTGTNKARGLPILSSPSHGERQITNN